MATGDKIETYQEMCVRKSTFELRLTWLDIIRCDAIRDAKSIQHHQA